MGCGYQLLYVLIEKSFFIVIKKNQPCISSCFVLITECVYCMHLSMSVRLHVLHRLIGWEQKLGIIWRSRRSGWRTGLQMPNESKTLNGRHVISHCFLPYWFQICSVLQEASHQQCSCGSLRPLCSKSKTIKDWLNENARGRLSFLWGIVLFIRAWYLEVAAHLQTGESICVLGYSVNPNNISVKNVIHLIPEISCCVLNQKPKMYPSGSFYPINSIHSIHIWNWRDFSTHFVTCLRGSFATESGKDKKLRLSRMPYVVLQIPAPWFSW